MKYLIFIPSRKASNGVKNKNFIKKQLSITYITLIKLPINIDYIDDLEVAKSFI